MTSNELRKATVGCLLGTAVGDAVGLCCEGLPPARQAKMYPRLDGPHFLGRRGMVSDDTEHACMVAQAMVAAGEDTDAFAQCLARLLRGWLLMLPAGIGLATLKACLKLLVGVGPERSGVFSAGNGPAMRSPIIGVAYNRDMEGMRRLVRASTRITHTDPKAESGALAVALAAALASIRRHTISPDEYLCEAAALLPPEAAELSELLERAVRSAEAGERAGAFVRSLGLTRGITGYVYHTVPAVIQAWLRHQDDFSGGITEIVRCGGDADTTAAILGGIIGARVGRDGIPAGWLDRLAEWPRTVAWMEDLGGRLAFVRETGGSRSAPRLSLWRTALRNGLFTTVVLAHGVRRLLPPY